VLSFECDFCGRRIDDADEFVTVRSLGSRTTCNVKPKVPRGALARQGLDLEAISKMTDDQLLAIRGVGERTVRRLRDAIREAGL